MLNCLMGIDVFIWNKEEEEFSNKIILDEK